jgi:hypothetical protein
MKMKYLIFKRINKNLSKFRLTIWASDWVMRTKYPNKKQIKKSYKTQSLDNPLHLKGKIKKNN